MLIAQLTDLRHFQTWRVGYLTWWPWKRVEHVWPSQQRVVECWRTGSMRLTASTRHRCSPHICIIKPHQTRESLYSNSGDRLACYTGANLQCCNPTMSKNGCLEGGEGGYLCVSCQGLKVSGHIKISRFMLWPFQFNFQFQFQLLAWLHTIQRCQSMFT